MSCRSLAADHHKTKVLQCKLSANSPGIKLSLSGVFPRLGLARTAQTDRGFEISDMMVSPNEVFKAAHAIGNQANELRDGLEGLSRDWDSLSHGWSGAAASAFTPAWAEWHEGVTTLIAMLTNWADRMARAAVAYEQQDGEVAGMVGSAGAEI